MSRDDSALEGASLLLAYVEEEERDAQDAKAYIAKVSPGTKVELITGDLSKESQCLKVVDKAKEIFNGRIDILWVEWWPRT